MFYTKTREVLCCDCCFEELEWSDYDLDWFRDQKEKAESEGWEVHEDDKAYCPVCKQYDHDDYAYDEDDG